LANFDAATWQGLRGPVGEAGDNGTKSTTLPTSRFYGSDRDAGAIEMSRANAAHAGVAEITEFAQHAISDLVAPSGPPGLVIVNPPYGTRVGDKKPLYPLYHALGHTLLSGFKGWRVGLITNEASLAGATDLPFATPSGSVSHGGLRVTLYLTGALA
jgi:putative N6-adenine-specific DNA methylase